MMKDKAVFHIAASSLIIAATMMGCSGAAVSDRADAHKPMIQMAEAQAQEAEKALSRKNIGQALSMAEAAVMAEPRNAAYRILLGRAYLASGRYGSAQQSFNDAMTLGGADSRTVVNLSLLKAVEGDLSAAQDVLNAHIDKLSAADYGLAMAMVGNPEEAVRMLSQAIHDPGATSRERQNLAYAHAMAGQWTEARQVASLDMTPVEATQRVAHWAQQAQPGTEGARIIAMFGVQPIQDDAGVPTRLALNPVNDTAVQLADVTGEDTSAGDRAMLAAVADERHSSAPLPSLYGPSTDGPSVIPVAQPVVRAPVAGKAVGKARLELPDLKSSSMPVKTAKVAVAARPVKTSPWVVQLGAFATPQAAQLGHKQLVKRNAAIGRYQMMTSRVQVDGKPLHRLAVSGFADQAEAQKLCASIKAQKGSCFVRQGDVKTAPERWVKDGKASGGKRVALH